MMGTQKSKGIKGNNLMATVKTAIDGAADMIALGMVTIPTTGIDMQGYIELVSYRDARVKELHARELEEKQAEAAALKAKCDKLETEKGKRSAVKARTGGESVREQLLKAAEPLREQLRTALVNVEPVAQSSTACAMAQSAAMLANGDANGAAGVLHGGAIVNVKGTPHARRFPTYGGSFFRGITVTLPLFNVEVPANMRAALKAVELEWNQLTANLPAAPKGSTSGDGDEE